MLRRRKRSIEREILAEASLIQKEQDAVQKKLDSVKKRFEKKQAMLTAPVTVDVVAEVVSAWTKVPVSKLAESDAQRLKNLEACPSEESDRTGRGCRRSCTEP